MEAKEKHLALQVMIANPLSRRKGLAYEALILFMLYGITNLVSIVPDLAASDSPCMTQAEK